MISKHIKPKVRNDAKTSTLSLCSRAIVNFKRHIIGLPNGSKSNLLGIPIFIKNDERLLINCIRGIADTDFSLFFYKKNGLYAHPAISCSLSNIHLVNDLELSLRSLGFIPSTRYNILRERKGNINTEHILTICGKKQLKGWMEIIGF